MLTAFFAIFYASFGIAQASCLMETGTAWPALLCFSAFAERPVLHLPPNALHLASPQCPPPACSPPRPPQAQTAFPDLAKAAGACQRVFRILDSRPSTGHTVALPDPSADPEAATGGPKRGKASAGVVPQQAGDGGALAAGGAGAEVEIEGRVELRRVAFAYPTRPQRLVLKEFNLAVPAGTSCALVRRRLDMAFNAFACLVCCLIHCVANVQVCSANVPHQHTSRQRAGLL